MGKNWGIIIITNGAVNVLDSEKIFITSVGLLGMIMLKPNPLLIYCL